MQKQKVIDRIGHGDVVKRLFHGTAEDSIKQICYCGFDRGFAGKNGTVQFIYLS